MSESPDLNRKTCRRDYWYGRSRANRWPLWLSWLLAPNAAARNTVRHLQLLKGEGHDA